MKKSFVLLLFTLISSSFFMAYAENLPLSAEASERASLAIERGKIQSQYTHQETDCYKTFAVDSCLKKANTEKRVALADIKRRELAMNELQRQKKKAEIDLKMSKSATQSRAATGVDHRNRSVKPPLNEDKRAEDAKKRAQEANQKMMASQTKAAQRAQKSNRAKERAARYQKKLREAEEHKIATEQKKSSNTKPKAASLPVPKSIEN